MIVKQPWEMTYEELFWAWYAKHSWMPYHDARNMHRKWMRLGILASKGRL